MNIGNVSTYKFAVGWRGFLKTDFQEESEPHAASVPWKTRRASRGLAPLFEENLASQPYPRLLLITSNAFNHLSGGGVTFTNLFGGWPKEKIACAHSDKIKPTTDVCENYYFLGHKEFPWTFPFSLANFFGGQEKVFKSFNVAKSSEKGKSLKQSFLRTIQKTAQKIFGDEIPMNAVIPGKLREWIREFKPDVIYTTLGSLQYMALVEKVSEEFNLPVVIHIMDDWPEVIYSRGVFGPYRKLKMKVALQKLMNKAAARLGICDAMSEAYEKRYEVKFQGAFHNALDSHEWIKKAKKNWKSNEPFNLLYAGALMPDSQLGSVKDVCDAVEELHKRGVNIRFNIYAPWYFANPYRSELERKECVKVLEMPETMDVEKLFAEADLLLLPVNFDEASVKYIKYSMPTKVPAYMFSGTPTLAYGPREVASIKYALEYKWAYCITERNKKSLIGALEELAADEKKRENFALTAQKIAVERHDKKRESERFHEVLINAAKR